MTIDFIKDDNELDFQAENNIDFQEDESPIRLEGKVEEIVEPTTMQKIGSGARDFGKGVVQGLSSLGAGIGMRYGNTWRRKLGMRELTEYEKQNRYAKLLGKPVNNTAGKAGKVVGEVLPFLAAPETSIPKLGMWGNLALTGAYQGALGSGTSSIAEKGFSKDLGKDTAIGAATGIVGTTAIGGILNKIKGNAVDKAVEIAEESKPKNLEAESIKDNLRNLINNRRSNIDLANYDTSLKINKFISEVDDVAKELKINPKQLREIMPFIRENTDLPIKNFDRKDLHQIYKSLTEDSKNILKTLAHNHFKDLEINWNKLAEVKELKSFINPEEYITHIWDISDADKKFLNQHIRTNSQFELGRVIPTYKQGIENGLDIMVDGITKHINLKPKTLDYAEIQKLHANQLIDATENTKFMRAIDEIKLPNGKPISAVKEFQEILKPVLESSLNPKKTDNLAKQLLEKAGNGYDMVNNFAKGCKFLFNGMHAVALTESSAAHSSNILPFQTIKTLGNIPKIIDGIKNNNYELFKNSKLAREAIKDGVQFGAISDINIGEFNTFMDGFSKVLDKVTFGASKGITKSARTMIDTNNKFLWNYLHNTYKLHTYDTLIKRVSENGKKALSKNVRRDIAQLVNDTFGGQNWDTLGIKPSSVKKGQRLLLSPDWNMSATIRQSLAIFSSEAGQKFLNKFAQSSKFGSAVREFSRKLGLSSFTNDIKGAGVRGQQARRYFMMFLAQTAIYSNAINACCRTVDYMKDKEKYPEGIKNLSSYSNNRFTEKDSIGQKVVNNLFPRPFVGQNEHGREVYARIGKQALEVPELIEDLPNSAIRKVASKSAPLINPVVTKISDEYTNNWNKASVKDRYKDTFTPFTLNKKEKLKPIYAFYSTTKGINSFQARAYLKECILNGDMEAIEKFKPKMKANKIDFDRAMKRVYKEIEEEYSVKSMP